MDEEYDVIVLGKWFMEHRPSPRQLESTNSRHGPYRVHFEWPFVR